LRSYLSRRVATNKKQVGKRLIFDAGEKKGEGTSLHLLEEGGKRIGKGCLGKETKKETPPNMNDSEKEQPSRNVNLSHVGKREEKENSI